MAMVVDMAMVIRRSIPTIMDMAVTEAMVAMVVMVVMAATADIITDITTVFMMVTIMAECQIISRTDEPFMVEFQTGRVRIREGREQVLTMAHSAMLVLEVCIMLKIAGGVRELQTKEQ